MSRQLPLKLRLKDSASFENFLPAHNREAVERVRTALAGFMRGTADDDSRDGGGRTASGDGRDAGGTTSGKKEVERRLEQPPRATPGAVAGTAVEPVLFLYGAPGTGRTHLLQAACRVVQTAGGSALYIPFSDIASFTPAILEDLDQVSLVCLDDVERIAGQAAWELAVFALSERLRASGGMLLVAGSRPPRELGAQLPDLVTRLGWGPVYALAPLSDDERLEAVRLRARNRGLEMPDEVVRYILVRYPRDLDTLFALLDRLDSASLAEQRRLTVPFLRSLEEKTL